MTSVLLVTEGADGVVAISQAVGQAGRVESVASDAADDVLLAAADARCEVIVVAPSVPSERQLEVAALFDRRRPDVTVVLVAHATPELFADALTVGVRDIVSPDARMVDLQIALERAAEATRRRWSQIGEFGPAERPSRVITVLSPKGGSGKTTVATNLAVGLARRAPGDVVLVDLDLQFGDVAGALRLEPDHSLADATQLGERLDLTTLKVFLTAHRSGLYVLCSPDSLVDADAVDSGSLKRVLTLLIEAFPFVVIDTAGGIGEHTLAALESSTDFLLVCSTEVPSIRGVQRQVEAFDAIQLVDQRRTFVVNRSNARVGLSVDDVSATVGLPVSVAIPSSRNVVISTNQGEPIIEGDARDPVRRAFEDLADLYLPRADRSEPPRPAGVFRRNRG